MDQNNQQSSQANDKKVEGSNTVKNAHYWTTEDEPMTGAQHSYLKTLLNVSNLDKHLQYLKDVTY